MKNVGTVYINVIMQIVTLMIHVIIAKIIRTIKKKKLTRKLRFLTEGVKTMAKNKPRWKDLPFYERFAKQLKQRGVSDEMCEHIREKGKKKEKQNNE